MAVPLRLYLDQNYLSGIAKRKPAFGELEPVLRAAVERGRVQAVESEVHGRESAPRPDLGLIELLHGLSGGARLPEEPGRATGDLDAMAAALVHCNLVTCDAFMADVIRRTRLDLKHGCELFTGRRADVLRLRDRLAHALCS